MGILLDAIAQWLILGASYPGAALVVGPMLITIPYALARRWQTAWRGFTGRLGETMSDAKNPQGSKLYSLLGKVQSAEKLFLSGRRNREADLESAVMFFLLIQEARRGVPE